MSKGFRPCHVYIMGNARPYWCAYRLRGSAFSHIIDSGVWCHEPLALLG